MLNDFQELFYVSLEALKNVCIKDYNAVVNYDLEPRYILNNLHNGHKIMYSINSKKDELNAFARQYNITFDDFKNVIKGKWLLHGY